jgi:hypothetical protein
MKKIRTGAGFHFTARAARDFLKFRVYRTGTKGADTHTSAAESGAERFLEAGDVRFGRSVNRKIRDRKKAGR